MPRKSTIGLVREGQRKVRGSGFLVTWDVDSRDRTAVNRTQYFLFGRTLRENGKEYRYGGFVWTEGVRYLAQSAVFVLPHRLAEIRGFLERNGIERVIDPVIFP